MDTSPSSSPPSTLIHPPSSTPTSALTPLLHPSLSSLLLPIYPDLLPLQSHLLPLLLNPHVIHNPRDLSVTAETGSGKTLCFVLPIINSILKSSPTQSSRVKGNVQAVVILPTVNLAQQVYSDFMKFTAPLNITLSLDTVSSNARTMVVIATPGSVKRRFEEGGDWVKVRLDEERMSEATALAIPNILFSRFAHRRDFVGSSSTRPIGWGDRGWAGGGVSRRKQTGRGREGLRPRPRPRTVARRCQNFWTGSVRGGRSK